MANLVHGELPAAQAFDWNLGVYGEELLFLQAILFVVIASFFNLVSILQF
jgi:hypothetical protein